MNNLSWFLYAADFLQSVSILLTFICILSVISMCVFTGMSLSARSNEEEFPYKLNYLWIPILMLALITAAIPSKNTMYAIAASEMGEKAYSSKLGQKSMAAIEKWIDSQLTEGE